MNARPMPSAAISSASVATPPLDLAAVRCGSPGALATVYRRHAPAMLTLAYRLTASRADAEDVVHDVFVALPEALARYDERGQFGAWLARLTTRVALMHQRRQSRLVGDEGLESVAFSGATEPDVLFADRVQQSLQSLSPALRQVFVLRVLYEHSHAEIAELLGIAINTSEVRLHRAVQQLRRVLEGESRLFALGAPGYRNVRVAGVDTVQAFYGRFEVWRVELETGGVPERWYVSRETGETLLTDGPFDVNYPSSRSWLVGGFLETKRLPPVRKNR